MPLAQVEHPAIYAGGAEANVAGALASPGHTAAMVSAVPEQALGEGGMDVRR